jgi:hypothetical protein
LGAAYNGFCEKSDFEGVLGRNLWREKRRFFASKIEKYGGPGLISKET